MRKGSKVKVNKVKSKRTCTAIFVVFLKCTLERRLDGFQQVSSFTSHFMNLSTTGLILLSLTSTFLHHLMKRKVIGLALLTTKVTLSPGGSSLRILKRSSFVLVSEVPLRTTTNQRLASSSGEGTTLLFAFLILNNLPILCHLTLLMHQPPTLSNLSKVSLVKMKIIQSPWPTLTFPIFLADHSFYT